MALLLAATGNRSVHHVPPGSQQAASPAFLPRFQVCLSGYGKGVCSKISACDCPSFLFPFIDIGTGEEGGLLYYNP